MGPMVVEIRYEYVGSVRVEGLCPRCLLPSLVDSIGVIVGVGMVCNRIRHCTDCGLGLP